MLPSRARAGPPDIGASMQPMPRSPRRAAIASVLAGPSVGQRTTQAPAPRAPCTSPSSPNRTASHCAASTTATITTGCAAASAAGVACAAAPARTHSASRAGSMSRTPTVQPSSHRRSAIAPPMLPTPMKPTLREIRHGARPSRADGASRAGPSAVRARRGCRSSSSRCRRGRAASAPRAGRRRGSAGGWRRHGAGCAARSARRSPPSRACALTSFQNICRVIGPPRAVTKSASLLWPPRIAARASAR